MSFFMLQPAINFLTSTYQNVPKYKGMIIISKFSFKNIFLSQTNSAEELLISRFTIRGTGISWLFLHDLSMNEGIPYLNKI